VFSSCNASEAAQIPPPSKKFDQLEISTMAAFIAADSLPAELVLILNESAKTDGLPTLLSKILEGMREIGTTLRACGYSSSQIGTQNAFGDNQLDVDVKTDELIFSCLRSSKLVHVAASEENPVEIDCGGSGFSVGFDPLDGSSIVDCNFAVGTIMGIWPGNGLLNRSGREQSAALIAQYGPKVTIALAINCKNTINGEAVAMELTMLPTGWHVSVPQLSIAQKGKTFAPGNLRATADNEQYRKLVAYWIENKYTLRYSGGLVPDVYHILIKGQGVLANASSPAAKAKLRLLFEAAPIALIIEAAGGSSCVCPSEVAEAMSPTSLLDVAISDLDKRVGVCYGSADEVERFKSYIFPTTV
jgi:sedoheptulose-bisphosphatase